MEPRAPLDRFDPPQTQAGHTTEVEGRLIDENRQPQMSQAAAPRDDLSDEPVFWLVPDTRDDIVVSRTQDD